MKRIFILSLLAAVLTVAAAADIKPPVERTPEPRPTVPLEPSPETRPDRQKSRAGLYIDVKSDAQEPTLVIKRSALRDLTASADSPTALSTEAGLFSRTQTVAGGLFLTLAFVTGGVWLFRRREKSPGFVMPLVGLLFWGVGATFVFGNMPPTSAVNLTSRIFDKSTKSYGYAKGSVKVVVSDDAEGAYDFYLQIPTDRRDKSSEEE